jgi:hypothetical protein
LLGFTSSRASAAEAVQGLAVLFLGRLRSTSPDSVTDACANRHSVEHPVDAEKTLPSALFWHATIANFQGEMLPRAFMKAIG